MEVFLRSFLDFIKQAESNDYEDRKKRALVNPAIEVEPQPKIGYTKINWTWGNNNNFELYHSTSNFVENAILQFKSQLNRYSLFIKANGDLIMAILPNRVILVLDSLANDDYERWSEIFPDIIKLPYCIDERAPPQHAKREGYYSLTNKIQIGLYGLETIFKVETDICDLLFNLGLPREQVNKHNVWINPGLSVLYVAIFGSLLDVLGNSAPQLEEDHIHFVRYKQETRWLNDKVPRDVQVGNNMKQPWKQFLRVLCYMFYLREDFEYQNYPNLFTHGGLLNFEGASQFYLEHVVNEVDANDQVRSLCEIVCNQLNLPMQSDTDIYVAWENLEAYRNQGWKPVVALGSTTSELTPSPQLLFFNPEGNFYPTADTQAYGLNAAVSLNAAREYYLKYQPMLNKKGMVLMTKGSMYPLNLVCRLLLEKKKRDEQPVLVVKVTLEQLRLE